MKDNSSKKILSMKTATYNILGFIFHFVVHLHLLRLFFIAHFSSIFCKKNSKIITIKNKIVVIKKKTKIVTKRVLRYF